MKKVGSFIIAIPLMFVCLFLELRVILFEVVLNEAYYVKLQEELNLADSILEQVTLDLQTLMRTNNLPDELVGDLIPKADIEKAIQLQTKETIELLKGNQDTMTIIDAEPYIWELEPRIMNYLNEQGYKVEEGGYSDLDSIVKGVYDLSRGDIHLFDISKLMYSGTIIGASMIIQFLSSSIPYVLLGIIVALYLLIWKKDWRQIIYWIASASLAAGLFGTAILKQIPNRAIGFSTNQAFNQGITQLIAQFSRMGQSISLVFILGASFVIFLLIIGFTVNKCKKS